MGRKPSTMKRIVKKVARGSIMDTVREAAGEEALPVVTYLKGRRNISEFEIASNIKEEVGRVRQMLYRLQTKNLVTYFRKKDKIKGWYISYWTFNPKGAKYLAVKLEKEHIEEIQERLDREEKYKGLFYICPSFCTRLVFDEATEVDFKCSECGNVLQSQNNEKTIERLREKIKELEKKKK